MNVYRILFGAHFWVVVRRLCPLAVIQALPSKAKQSGFTGNTRTPPQEETAFDGKPVKKL